MDDWTVESLRNWFCLKDENQLRDDLAGRGPAAAKTASKRKRMIVADFIVMRYKRSVGWILNDGLCGLTLISENTGWA